MAANTVGTLVLQTNNIYHYMLFDAVDATAANDGSWIDMGPFRMDVSLDFSGIAGGTVLGIYGSNAKTKPADTSNGTLIGAAISADAIVALTAPPRWLKCRLTTTGTGTPSVGMIATNPAGGF